MGIELLAVDVNVEDVVLCSVCAIMTYTVIMRMSLYASLLH